MKPTLITSIGQAVTLVLTILATLPFTSGDLALLIPADWKGPVALASALATAILQVLKTHQQSQ